MTQTFSYVAIQLKSLDTLVLAVYNFSYSQIKSTKTIIQIILGKFDFLVSYVYGNNCHIGQNNPPLKQCDRNSKSSSCCSSSGRTAVV